MNSNNENNFRVLRLLSSYLNNNENAINTRLISKIMKIGISEQEAFMLLLVSFLGIDEEKELIDKYFKRMIHRQDYHEYENNPYYKNIKLTKHKLYNWEIKNDCYKAYEAFVCDDFIYDKDLVIPQIGYFSKPFYFPAIFQDGRLWMSVTPNEINTMEKPIKEAFGNVLTFGLGLGYFAYMASLKEEVKSITIIETSQVVIDIFNKYIFNQFKYKEKIKIIKMDAFSYLNQFTNLSYDYAFVDIYHDASDGKEIYLRFKPYEEKYPNIRFSYWIFDTIKFYL